MLAFKYRFHGHSSLRYVYKNGQALRSRLVTVKYSSNPHRKDPRFAVVVSKKILKSAVGRNRIRRRLYESVRTNLVGTIASQDVVFIVSLSEIINVSPAELDELVKSLLTQAGLYNK